jgi:hypothetical protein
MSYVNRINTWSEHVLLEQHISAKQLNNLTPQQASEVSKMLSLPLTKIFAKKLTEIAYLQINACCGH